MFLLFTLPQPLALCRTEGDDRFAPRGSGASQNRKVPVTTGQASLAARKVPISEWNPPLAVFRLLRD